MPSAGALPAPYITPIHRECHGLQLPVNKIDISTLIEISTDAPNCKLYFTSDGSKPLPFQRKIGGKELTFKYIAPFTLKPGKRALKAVAVSRDGLLESAVVTKSFNVVDLESQGVPEGYETSSSSMTLQSFLDESSDNEYSLKPGKIKDTRRKKSPVRKRPQLHDAWASSLPQDPIGTGAVNENQYPPIPDGPFNPTNYSGTQINVWGAPPGSWPGMNANNGTVTFGSGPPAPPYPVQYGFLTDQMIKGLKPKEEPKPQGLTLGDVRKLLDETRRKPHPLSLP